ncbi:MAG: Type 1 glutamine amidotransferase-like domain-containing protein [Longimicrobiales bacterium]
MPKTIRPTMEPTVFCLSNATLAAPIRPGVKPRRMLKGPGPRRRWLSLAMGRRVLRRYDPTPVTLAAVVIGLMSPFLVPLPVSAQPQIGPSTGALIIAGGGRLDSEITDRFLDLAGGKSARIVVIPTAGEQDSFPTDWSGTELFRDAGVASVTVLHTRDRNVADSEAFVAPLRSATAVWIPGGRQWRLADAYLGTRTLRELFALLDRGGVIGGSSAGASIQASYMVRGAPEGNHIVMAEGHEAGFGFLRGAAIDQHLTARGREADMLAVIAKHPDLLGIGLDEGTAILVRGNEAQVIGRSKVAFYNAADAPGTPYYFLESGDVFDLATRRTKYGEKHPPLDPAIREAVSTVQQLFDAMRASDTAAVRSVFHPDAKVFVPSAGPTPSSIRVSGVDDFVRSIASASIRYDERFRDPDVVVDGNLAAVWTYYDFFRGETFSHCGIDAFHLARLDDEWKILQIAYTVRNERCRGRSG